jgi:uncharacterized protein YqgV (UPF0045/DUF77 family)
MIMELQVLPVPSGTQDAPHRHIDAAIEEIAQSGLTFEVGPLGTSIEGSPDALWALARRVHEASLRAGAKSCISMIKVAEGSDVPNRMSDLTSKHRP